MPAPSHILQTLSVEAKVSVHEAGDIERFVVDREGNRGRFPGCCGSAAGGSLLLQQLTVQRRQLRAHDGSLTNGSTIPVQFLIFL